MDRIDPIAPGVAPIARAARTPVRRLQAVARERDRPDPEDLEQRRERGAATPEREGSGEDGSEPRHVDVRV